MGKEVSGGQQLQKLYCLLVSANIYVTPVINNHIQGTHVLAKDTPAFLWGWRGGTALSAKARHAPKGAAGDAEGPAGKNQKGTAALGHAVQTHRWLIFF